MYGRERENQDCINGSEGEEISSNHVDTIILGLLKLDSTLFMGNARAHVHNVHYCITLWSQLWEPWTLQL